MMNSKDNAHLVEQFKESAGLVSAIVTQVETDTDVIDYVSALLSEKKYSDIKIAAPEFSDSFHLELNVKVPDAVIIKNELGAHSEGIPISITRAEFGIAETGTLVINSKDIDRRLATMIADIHVCLISESNIVATLDDIVDELNEVLSQPSEYLAFITGASRTADIERVLVVGVHGPLELHILIKGGA